MSGIYIPNVDMPETGQFVPVYKIQGKFFVGINSQIYPLIPVPDHGDLIDREALLDTDPDVCRLIDWDANTCEYGYSASEILRAPTIIPSDNE